MPSDVFKRARYAVSIFTCQVSDLLTLLQHSYVDQSPLVARRLGFASLPLAAVAILVGSQSLNLIFTVTSDFTYPWTWTLRMLSQAEVVYYATWTIVGLLFWLWCVSRQLV